MALVQDQYYTAKELARHFSVGVTTIYDWRKNKGFPQGRLLGGNMRRFLGAEVAAWAGAQPVK